MLLLIFLVVLHGAGLPNGILFLLGYAAFLKTIVLHLPFRKRRNYVAYLVLGHILLGLLFQSFIFLDLFLHRPFRKRRNYFAYLVLGHILLVLLFQSLILLDFFLHEIHFFSLFLLNLVMIFLI